MKGFEYGGLEDGLAMDKGEAEFLYGLVRATRPSVCLEIGTHRGYSTQHLIEALVENNHGHLWTTDPFDYEAEAHVRFEYRPFVTFLHQRGDEVKLEAPIDFVFVDGLHSIDDVDLELKNILPQLAEEAVVVFHDAQNEPTNWKRGVNAALKKHKLKTVWLPTKYCLQVYQHRKEYAD